MTAQIMDTIVFEDQPWALADADWQAFREAVPSSLALGFETRMEHTANYSGRVDRYEVRGGRLYLDEAQVKLAEACSGFEPPRGMSRRDVTTRSWATVWDAYSEDLEGRDELTELCLTYLGFDACLVPYTGTLVGGREFCPDLHVHGGYQRANRFHRRLILSFEAGHLIPQECRLEFGAESDAQANAERKFGRELMATLLGAAGLGRARH